MIKLIADMRGPGQQVSLDFSACSCEFSFRLTQTGLGKA